MRFNQVPNYKFEIEGHFMDFNLKWYHYNPYRPVFVDCLCLD